MQQSDLVQVRDPSGRWVGPFKLITTYIQRSTRTRWWLVQATQGSRAGRQHHARQTKIKPLAPDEEADERVSQAAEDLWEVYLPLVVGWVALRCGTRQFCVNTSIPFH